MARNVARGVDRSLPAGARDPGSRVDRQAVVGLTAIMRIVIICQMNPRPANAPGAPLDDAQPLPRQASAKVATPRTSSRALFGDARELLIDHEGREYRLRITQNGKLILTA